MALSLGQTDDLIFGQFSKTADVAVSYPCPCPCFLATDRSCIFILLILCNQIIHVALCLGIHNIPKIKLSVWPKIVPYGPDLTLAIVPGSKSIKIGRGTSLPQLASSSTRPHSQLEVESMLGGKHFPELGTDLAPKLTFLDVNDFSHIVLPKMREVIQHPSRPTFKFHLSEI